MSEWTERAPTAWERELHDLMLRVDDLFSTDVLSRTDGQKRRRGAELGNQRAWRHGRRSRAAEMRRKAGAASRKAAGLILARLDLLGI